jgi:regulator of protease activity HflC (stomatin/prohibitin superfamily)
LRLGKPLDPPRGSGRVWTIPRIDQLVIVDMRPTLIDSPSVVVITKDSASLSVRARLHAQVVAPKDAALRVVDHIEATSLIAGTALRAVFKEHSRDEALFDRTRIEAIVQSTINDATASWGVDVSAVEIDARIAPSGLV